MVWKIFLAFGILGQLLGLLVTGISTALPIITEGRTRWGKAAIGIIPGIIVLLFSFLVFMVSLIFAIKNRGKNKVSG